jgi:hypothetical protein
MMNCERCKSGYELHEFMVMGLPGGTENHKTKALWAEFIGFLQIRKSMNICVAVGTSYSL